MSDLFEIASMLCLFALGAGLVVLVGMAVLRLQGTPKNSANTIQFDEALWDLAVKDYVRIQRSPTWLNAEPFAPHPYDWAKREPMIWGKS